MLVLKCMEVPAVFLSRRSPRLGPLLRPTLRHRHKEVCTGLTGFFFAVEKEKERHKKGSHKKKTYVSELLARSRVL